MGAEAAQGYRCEGRVLKPAVALRIDRVSVLAAEADAQPRGWLDAGEADRLAATGSPQRSRQFLAGHWLARPMAAAATGTRPHGWLLSAATTGAPGLALRDGGVHGLHLSISHSGDIVAVAIASIPVGIDVEAEGRVRDWLALADEVFAPQECAQLRTAEGRDRSDMFHRFWTLKEAFGKRDGSGLRPHEARSQCAVLCDESEALAIAWQFGGQSLALAGEQGMRIDLQGMSCTAKRSFWRFDSAG
jgi:4'-phosphopantetheinyl transferase